MSERVLSLEVWAEPAGPGDGKWQFETKGIAALEKLGPKRTAIDSQKVYVTALHGLVAAMEKSLKMDLLWTETKTQEPGEG